MSKRKFEKIQTGSSAKNGNLHQKLWCGCLQPRRAVYIYIYTHRCYQVRTSTPCGCPSFRHRRGRASTLADSSSFPDHFPSPATLPNSSFPARSLKTSNKVNLAGKLKFDGLAGDRKWSGKLLESARVEACPRRRRTVANGEKLRCGRP